MLQFVPHLQGIFGTILPSKISKNKLKMSATITTSGILCSWALEANLKWNTNVLAEWLDMDLNRKRKRKHYFQYGQVAGGGALPQRPVQWAHESRSPCPALRQGGGSSWVLDENEAQQRRPCPDRPQTQTAYQMRVCRTKSPKNSTGTEARVQGRQSGRQGRVKGCKGGKAARTGQSFCWTLQ